MTAITINPNQIHDVREALISSIETAGAARSKATYDHSKEDQIKSVQNQIKTTFNVSREIIPIVVNQPGVTGFYASEAILNQLKQGTKKGRNIIVNHIDWLNMEYNALYKAVSKLEQDNGITYVLRMFQELKNRKINNSRSKRLALTYILNHSNLEFISVKYRQKVANILEHCFGRDQSYILQNIAFTYSSSDGSYVTHDSNNKLIQMLHKYTDNTTYVLRMIPFIFKNKKASQLDYSDYPIISSYYKAKEDVRSVDNIPAEILHGLVSDVNHPQHTEFYINGKLTDSGKKELVELTTKTTTANAAVRQTKRNIKLGVEASNVDTRKITDFVALYKTMYENQGNESIVSDTMKLIQDLAYRRRLKDFQYGNIGIIVDDSKSMGGHSIESKNTPRAIAQFTKEVLVNSVQSAKVVEHNTVISDVAKDFIKLVKQGSYDAIFILSDGYENSYEGLLNEVITAWRNLNNENANVPIYHVSPQVGSEMNANVRKLGSNVSTLSVNKPEVIKLQFDKVLLEQDIKRWIELQVENFQSLN